MPLRRTLPFILAIIATLAPRVAFAPPAQPGGHAGLRSAVRIVTDRWGVPHLHAANLDDLYYAWGYVTARDRMWELEITRRSAEGRLWEWFGNATLVADGGAELFGFRERAARAWALQRRDPETARALERYADGINAWLAECRSGARPWRAEFTAIGRTPADWKPEDSLLELLGFGVLLDLALPELDEGRVIATRGRDRLIARSRFDGDGMYDTVPHSATRRLWGATRPRSRATGARATELPPALLARARATLAPWAAPADRDGANRASNAFAVGPGRGARGAPLLANDPHLALGAPGPLHLVHVTVPGLVDAVGAAPVGIPAIVSGRNARVAWGVTALSADVVDVYADTLSQDGRRVRWNGHWEPLRREPFRMRYHLLGVPLPTFGQERRYTPNGPVVAVDRARGVALSVRWAGLERPALLTRLIGAERARSAAEACERFRQLVTPGLNVIAADRDGAVRYQAVGLVPHRTADPGPGPLPGGGASAWDGFIAPEAMPAWSPPRDGFVVNANNRPAGPPYPDPLPRYDWFHDRARRIATRLAGDRSLTLADMASVQNDVHSTAAERLLPLLLRCADSVASTPLHREALDSLRAWDRLARTDRVAPTLFRGWVGAYTRRAGFDGTPGLLAAALDGRAPEALEDPRGYPERPAEAAIRSLDLALDSLRAALGPRLATWRYGRAHQASFRHRLGARAAGFQPRPVPADGDNSTPSVGASSLPWRTTFTHGPVFRHVVDLAVAESSLAVLPPGNRGEPGDPHARDMLRLWANHGYVPLHLDWRNVERVKESEETLSPRGR